MSFKKLQKLRINRQAYYLQGEECEDNDEEEHKVVIIQMVFKG